MIKVCVFCVFCAATLCILSNVSAQPALERLEKDVRRQLEEGGKPRGPAAKTLQEKAAGATERAAAPSAAPERGYLGALLEDRDDRGRGVRVVQVHPGSPAEKAGLQKGDLITALSGIRVRQLSEVADILEPFPPQTEVTFLVRRGQADRQADRLITVTLGHRPPGAPAGDTQPQPRIPPPPKPPQLGPPADSGVQPPADTLLLRIEALEREVQALKQQNQKLQQQIEALQRAVAPRPATP